MGKTLGLKEVLETDSFRGAKVLWKKGSGDLSGDLSGGSVGSVVWSWIGEGLGVRQGALLDKSEPEKLRLISKVSFSRR